MASISSVIRDPYTRMEVELEQWGRWVRSERPGGMGSNVLAALRGSTVPEPAITDDRALTIDAAMVRLRRAEPTLWGALWYQFAEGRPPYKWARLVGVGRQAAYYTVLPQAIRWMLGEVGIGEL